MTKYLLLLFLLLVSCVGFSGCSYNVQPDQTTVEYGTSENGKNKTNKGITQTFKWNKK